MPSFSEAESSRLLESLLSAAVEKDAAHRATTALIETKYLTAILSFVKSGLSMAIG